MGRCIGTVKGSSIPARNGLKVLDVLDFYVCVVCSGGCMKDACEWGGRGDESIYTWCLQLGTSVVGVMLKDLSAVW